MEKYSIGDSELMGFVRKGDIDGVRSCLSIDVNINKTNNLGQSALTIAAQKGNLELIKLLLGAGAELESKINFNISPLMIAARSGHLKIVNYLIQSGADVNYGEKFTPLVMAVYSGRIDVIQSLIENGAKVDDEVKCGSLAGMTALQVSVVEKNQSSCLTLIEYGADPFKVTSCNDNALGFAKKLGNQKIIEILLGHG